LTEKEKSKLIILIDIDGTLVPYVNHYRHFYQCACGRNFNDSSLDKNLPIACPSCGGISFKRDEPSIEECRLFITDLLSNSLSPYPGSVGIVNQLSLKHEIIYFTTREYAFFEETKTWLFNHGFPFKASTQLIMREDNNRDHPYQIKEKILTAIYRDKKEMIIIDDDLSLASLTKKLGLHFIRAPICWEEGTYYGDLLQRIGGLKT
jgi:DNA-directed RNA polymerase subunit RPC12/RpoP